MIQMPDFTAPLPEAKSKRKELRLKPTVAKAIETAAEAVGMDESTFIASAAYREAQHVQVSQNVTVLPQEQFDAFVAAVDDDAQANEALAESIAKSRRLFA